jgi:uncharacterized protein YndB with AHSA1/START domain
VAAKRTKETGATGGAANELVMTRILDAPRTLVFAAFTERRHLERWQGAPEGMTVTVEESDIRPGGRYRICMHAADGTEHWLEGVYREVVPPERLVFTHSWLDARKQPTVETLVTITFADCGGKTELTLRQTGLASPASRAGHDKGWGSTFNRLQDYLESVR